MFGARSKTICFFSLIFIFSIKLSAREITEESNTLWFGEEKSTEIELVGGKGASLSYLQSVPGIKVPEGFIVTTLVYKQVLDLNEELKGALIQLDSLSDLWLDEMIQTRGASNEKTDMLEEQISKQSQEARNLLLSLKMPPKLEQQITEMYEKLSDNLATNDLPVAVRSSATAEDLPGASFAGQHDTFLNQKGKEQVIQSVVASWASLFHPHTVQYRNTSRLHLLEEHKIEKIDGQALLPGDGLKHRVVSLAVVIQRIIQAKVAGVGFNVSTIGEEQIHLDANYGLGETVVGGLASPDSWEIDPEATKILHAKLGDKSVKAISKEDGGVQIVPVPEIDRQLFVLSSEQALEIARAIVKIGAYYQEQFGYKYIDTEFVMDESGTLYFVQARPETVFSMDEAITIEGVPKDVALQAKILFVGGATGFPGAHVGRLIYAKTPQEAISRIQPGDILLTTKTTPNWSIVFPKLGGIIVDIGGVLSHTAIVGREERIPTLLSAGNATKTLQDYDGMIVTIDALNGVVYEGAQPTVKGLISEFKRDDLNHDTGTANDLEIQIHRIDEEGKWMSRPNVILSKMQLQFLQNGYDQISDLLKLDNRIVHKVLDNKIFVKIENASGTLESYSNLTNILLTWDLESLQGVFDSRVRAVQGLLDFAEIFTGSQDQLKELGTLYQDWSKHFLLRGRFGHGAVATLMQEQMKKLADPSLLSGYMSLRYPMPNLTLEKQKEYQMLQRKLALITFADPLNAEQVKLEVQRSYPDLWEEILLYASKYEHVLSDDLMQKLPIDTVVAQLLTSLDYEGELGEESFKLTHAQVAYMDSLFSRDSELATIMSLAHKHLYQKENEHHLIAQANYKIRDGLIQLGMRLVEKGILKDKEEVFSFTLDELVHLSQEKNHE